MNKVKGPSIGWLLAIMAVLASIYIGLVYFIAKRPVKVEYEAKALKEVNVEYSIPEVAYTEDAVFERGANGIIHIYNDKCEIIMTDGTGDILEYTDPDGNMRIESSIDEKVNKEITIEAVRQFKNEDVTNTAVSYNYEGKEYGFIVVDETDEDKISAYIDKQVSLSK